MDTGWANKCDLKDQVGSGFRFFPEIVLSCARQSWYSMLHFSILERTRCLESGTMFFIVLIATLTTVRTQTSLESYTSAEYAVSAVLLTGAPALIVRAS